MIPAQTAFRVPGQGSQSAGMGRELAEAFPVARQVFEQADELLGFPLSRLAWEGPEADLNDTLNTQPALLVHSVAVLRVLDELHPGFRPAFVAGHSMGELSALVSSGALPYAQALHLTRRRGELMKRAGEVSPGGMAAIMGLEIPELERLCAEASTSTEIVQVANDNCPGQVVISGAFPALERALQAARQLAGERRVKPLAVSIAAHSPLMALSQADFNLAVQAAPIADPHTPLVGNVTASPLTTASQIQPRQPGKDGCGAVETGVIAGRFDIQEGCVAGWKRPLFHDQARDHGVVDRIDPGRPGQVAGHCQADCQREHEDSRQSQPGPALPQPTQGCLCPALFRRSRGDPP
ncbi:MAG TPA: ACP S-malonyltransferase [Anaerolineales bacterium]